MIAAVIIGTQLLALAVWLPILMIGKETDK